MDCVCVYVHTHTHTHMYTRTYTHTPFLEVGTEGLRRDICMLSRCHVQLCNPMDCIVCQAPLSMEFSRQEYWSGLPCPLSGDLPNPGIEPRSPALQPDSLLSGPPGKPKNIYVCII